MCHYRLFARQHYTKSINNVPLIIEGEVSFVKDFVLRKEYPYHY